MNDRSTNFVHGLNVDHEYIANHRSEYPYSLQCVRNLERLSFPSKVTFFVGENGSGKSTLLEAMAVCLRFNAEGGTRNFRFHTRESHSPLHQAMRIERGHRRINDGFFFRAESYFNVATEIENLDKEPGPSLIASYGGKSLHEQSHGESFMALFLHRFHGDGFYILDEPEAALSPQRQLTFLARLNDLVNEGAQFIIATHSPILLGFLPATIFEIGESGLRQVKWEDLEHVQITRSFLQNRSGMLRNIFGETEPLF